MKKKKRNNWLIKLLITIILTLIILICLKVNQTFKTKFYKYVYDTNFSFAEINNWYQNKFGSSIPFKDFFQITTPVFNEQLKYSEANLYKNGAKLKVENNYLVPALENGIVIFVGDKEEYGKTIIVQQSNGIDVWFANFKEVNVKLYDYIQKGSLLGEVDNELYIKFIKDGEELDYKDYL